ncbi:MAG: LysR family transcriptional regulator [Saccharopolyspora sp.]|uniref:LysR substrate-binding domain-containing protein n=1 Tax=Saccharopolyspora TaxID=1835 RepID=UPI00190C7EF4|nr:MULTISPECIES: LysR substrate-binding domain-containing protein [unclassified Saccharopolyspora]MBK0866869.1 LysR family transcriptional regulator [Saccharopolyspora sp. HNM0986]MBQ6642381.1 LysR family transcriptional regulator [Saccharopolyspora sp.]
MFTLNQLAGFVAVAEELHYGRAAERLRMTQPPLSRQIQLLEREIGVRLFDRGGRAVRLTPAGKAFLRDARRLLHEAENATLAVRRVPAGEAGSLRIGFTATSAYGLLGGVLETARDRLPHVDVALRELVTRDQLDMLSSAALDLGLMRPPITRPELDSRRVVTEPLLAALPAGHPLANGSEPLSPADFDGADVVMYSPTEARYFHELLVSIFREAHVTPHYTQHVSQVHTVLALVRAGLGLALVPSTATLLRFEGVVLRPVRLPEPEPVELHLGWRRANDNPALWALLGLL